MDSRRLPSVEAGDPATVGIHLAYISSEVHDISGRLDTVSAQVGNILATLAGMPGTYATVGGLQALADRVNALEADRDQRIGAAPTLDRVMHDVEELRREHDQTLGGQRWLWTAWLIATAVLGLAIALKGKVW